MRRLLRNAFVTGTIAAVATTVAAAVFAKAEKKGVAEVLNAPSHIAWGDEAFEAKKLDVKHTWVGIKLNALAVTMWALVSETILGRKRRTLTKTAVTAAAVTTAAYVADYKVVPKRLTPGFEEKLSKKALFGIYVVLGVALLAGGLKNDE